MNKRIAIILPTLSQTIEQNIVRGIKQSFQYHRIKCVFIPIGYLNDEQSFEQQQPRLKFQLNGLNIDGVILYGGGVGYRCSDKIMQALLATLAGYPLINIGSQLNGITSVLVDNYSGMYQLAEHLIAQGCHNFVYIDGPKDNYEAIQRANAISDALQKNGLSLSEANHLYGDMTTAKARALCKRWLGQNNQLPSAIMCTNDLTAKGVIEELQAQHIKIPEQVKVTGFDDFEYAHTMQPSLTTVFYPAEDIGALAAQLMLKRMDGIELKPEYQINTHPIFRESSGAHYIKPQQSSYDIQLRQIVQQRDSFAQRLTVTRLLHQRASLQEVLNDAQPLLSELGIPELYIYQPQFDDAGKQQVQLTHSLMPDASHNTLYLYSPTYFSDEMDNDQQPQLWVCSELKHHDEHLGYILAKTDLAHGEFIEFIAPQIADLIEHQRLLDNTRQYEEQAQLSEKMVALGGLVSGVAHEINTPLGNCLLAATHLSEQLGHFQAELQGNTLSRSKLNNFIENSVNSSNIIIKSSQRAAELISSFKHVAVDLSYEELRDIDLAKYIDDVLISLQHQLKNSNITLNKQLAANIELHTYPGAIAQVITNLFSNALQHGFNNKTRTGAINITLEKGKHRHLLTFTDNGKGASQEIQSHIFEPFYTTARGKGGSGLGMHIVFNIITQKLKWSLKVSSAPEQGFTVQIAIPAMQNDNQ